MCVLYKHFQVCYDYDRKFVSSQQKPLVSALRVVFLLQIFIFSLKLPAVFRFSVGV